MKNLKLATLSFLFLGMIINVVLAEENTAPSVPSVTYDTSNTLVVGISYMFSATSTDSNGDTIKYTFNWGDGTSSDTPFTSSGTSASASHSWCEMGIYRLTVVATDSKGANSSSTFSFEQIVIYYSTTSSNCTRNIANVSDTDNTHKEQPIPETTVHTLVDANKVQQTTLTQQQSAAVNVKCGVNSFYVSDECGIGAYRNAYGYCYDKADFKIGSDTSCKTYDIWRKYSEELCTERCGKTATTVISTVNTASTSSRSCDAKQELYDKYNWLVIDLKDAELSGNKDLASLRIQIAEIKNQISLLAVECASSTVTKPVSTTGVCNSLKTWEEKLVYYNKLSGLGDDDLKASTGYSREDVKRIISEIQTGLEKIRLQCKGNTATIETPPVVVDSGKELASYYKLRIEKIISSSNLDDQIIQLKDLRQEIDNLLVNLIKGKKEIGAAEISGFAKEIKISPGEIKADNAIVKTSDKRILIDIGTKQISVTPTEGKVLIMDKELEVQTDGVSVENNTLRVGSFEVKLTPGDAIEKLKITPNSMELKSENSKAVYKIKIDEARKLFGLFSVKMEKLLTADASGTETSILNEDLPWWAIFTSKSNTQ